MKQHNRYVMLQFVMGSFFLPYTMPETFLSLVPREFTGFFNK